MKDYDIIQHVTGKSQFIDDINVPNRGQIPTATEYLEHSSSDEHERNVQQRSGIQRQCHYLEPGQCN